MENDAKEYYLHLYNKQQRYNFGFHGISDKNNEFYIADGIFDDNIGKSRVIKNKCSNIIKKYLAIYMKIITPGITDSDISNYSSSYICDKIHMKLQSIGAVSDDYTQYNSNKTDIITNVRVGNTRSYNLHINGKIFFNNIGAFIFDYTRFANIIIENTVGNIEFIIFI